MEIEVLADSVSVADRAAKIIALEAQDAVATRGRFVLAVSGGQTPWLMLRKLLDEDVPWNRVHIVQVDERIAPLGSPDRNLTNLQEIILKSSVVPIEQIHAMPVELKDLDRAAKEYSATLQQIVGDPPVLDLVHLGLGDDGHTASLVPGDQVLNVVDADVAATGIYQGHRRMTLTYPILNRSRRILWLVTGSAKAKELGRLLAADPGIPAGRIRQDMAILVADSSAAESI